MPINNRGISTIETKLPAGLVTFLMTDIAGSTRLWESRAEAMRSALVRYDCLVLEAVTRHDGRVIKPRGEGDSHFAVFKDATQAVEAAIDIQSALKEETWETGAPLSVRMAVHTAEAEPVGDDYYGRDVNRCARIRGAAHGSQILVSDVTRDQVSALDFLDLGLHRLLDLSEPQRIYQVLATGLDREYPPLKSLNAVRHNLPVQLTSFVGRERELEELRRLILTSRLLSILGPGGAGKTRTALQLAAESIEGYPGGVWFVDLSGLRQPGLLPQKVIEDLFIRVGADDPTQAIANHFQGEKTLLLLDNCEHLAKEAAVLVDQLLKQCPNLTIVATSRQPLSVTGERAYRLPPMEVRAEHLGSLEDISSLDSVRLLLDRARTRGYEDVLLNAKPTIVLELCRKLDGIPLALEQAAANLGVLSPEGMLSKLDERLSVLRIDDEGVEARHRTLAAAIDWSYDALSDTERELFLDLAVFVGGWTLEAAEAICAQPRVLPVMQALVAKSLVWPEATTHGERRFRLLETVREYALEKRQAVPWEVQHRHLAYYSHLAKLSAEAGLDAEDGRWAKALDADHSNITVALNTSLSDPSTSNEGLELAVSMFPYWQRRDFYRQAGIWIQSALDAAPTAPAALKADALNRLGIFAILQRRLGPARAAIEASLELWGELGNDNKIGAALNNLALIANEQGDTASARSLFNRAVELFTKIDDLPRLSDALQNLAQLEWDEGLHESAIAHAERAVTLQRGRGDRHDFLAILTNLLGFYAEATGLRGRLDLVDEALELAKEVGNIDLTASLLDVIAFAANECGQPELAARYIGAATSLANQAGVELSRHSQRFRERLSGDVKRVLERQAFKRAFESGKGLTPSAALHEAATYIQTL